MIAIAAFASLAAASMISGEARGEGSGGIATAGGGDDTSAVGGESDSASRNSAKYERLWDRVDRRDRRWARRTAKCESGRDPDAIGGGGRYRGAFQFMKSTWKSAPKSPGGDPIAYSYRTQAVVAVLLKQRDGAGHWPVCG
ncbi:MAG: Transglycosylase domain protein [Solirubrobacterales bacterium]|nr:Transglycosylase domain protein [Solirubrobacterales bacterium]